MMVPSSSWVPLSGETKSSNLLARKIFLQMVSFLLKYGKSAFFAKVIYQPIFMVSFDCLRTVELDQFEKSLKTFLHGKLNNGSDQLINQSVSQSIKVDGEIVQFEPHILFQKLAVAGWCHVKGSADRVKFINFKSFEIEQNHTSSCSLPITIYESILGFSYSTSFFIQIRHVFHFQTGRLVGW